MEPHTQAEKVLYHIGDAQDGSVELPTAPRSGEFIMRGESVLQPAFVLLNLLAPPVTQFAGTPEPFRAVVTTIVLLAGLYVILSRKYPAKVEHWAYGIIGTIVGFWLRG